MLLSESLEYLRKGHWRYLSLVYISIILITNAAAKYLRKVNNYGSAATNNSPSLTNKMIDMY